MALPSKIDDAHLDNAFRKLAGQYPQVTDWLCPITGQLMKEPTTAEDGCNYERSAITGWFERGCSTSPRTNEEMGKQLKKNLCLRKTIQDFVAFVLGDGEELTLTWQPHGRSPTEMQKICLSREDVSQDGEPEQMCQALSSRFFQEVDPVKDLLHSMLNGLTPPQIVVLGCESAGKSTILEQLAMLPFFPRNRRCSTRLAIHLRLRRTPGISRATLTVLNAEGGEECRREIPQENGWLIVQEEMNRLEEELYGSEARKSERIISERVVVVKVERGDVPCLDLVDLPGLVKCPKEKAEQVNKIYARQVQEDRSNGNQCMYLAVVPASGQARPNTDPVMEFIMEHGLQDRTSGVFSKCDENTDADVLRALTLNENTEKDELPEWFGAVKLPNGWVATMQKPPNGEHLKYHNYERMYLQQKQEADFFKNPDLPERKQHFRELVKKHAAGIMDLVPRVEKMYSTHLQTFWKDHAMRQIFEKVASTQLDLSMLGIVEDEEERSLLAKEEVQRRLGPNSIVAQQMYKSFVAEVLHKTLVNKAREILADFPVGKRCEGFKYPELEQKMKEDLLQLLEDIVAEMEARMVTGVRNILEAKSELCGPGDFNIQTSSLRLYREGVHKSQWHVQEQLKAEPIIQLCHFRDYVSEIMKNHCKMLEEAKAGLRKSVGKLIDSLDTPSPYLKVTPSFLSQRDDHADYTDSDVIISCDIKQFLADILKCCYQHLPHPDRLQELYKDTPVGSETDAAKEECNRLKEELRLVTKAKDSVIQALAIKPEDERRIKEKFEVEQVELHAEEGGKLFGGHGSQPGPAKGWVADKVKPSTVDDIGQSPEADVQDVASGPSQVEEKHLLVASHDKIWRTDREAKGLEKEATTVVFGEDWADRLKEVLCRPENKDAIITDRFGHPYLQVEGHPGELHDVPPPQAFPMLVKAAANAEVDVAKGLEAAVESPSGPSGCSSWEAITSQSPPSSGDAGGNQPFDFDTLPWAHGLQLKRL